MSFSKWVVQFVLIAAMLLLGSSPADAYDLWGTQWPQSIPGEPVYLTYSYSNLLDGTLLDSTLSPVSEAELRAGVEEAMQIWATYAPLHFTEVVDNGPDGLPYDGGTEGDIRYGHHSIDGQGATTVKAHAYFPSTSTLAGDVHFDNADRWNLHGTLGFPDILGATIHELGHSLGLGHSLDENSNMWPTFIRMNGPGTGFLTPDDIAGIRAIYGTGVGSVTPLGVPEPSTLVLATLTALSLWIGRRDRCRLL